MHLQIVIHIDFMFLIFIYNVLNLGLETQNQLETHIEVQN